jgi:membrane-bound lytic murein transglycosylase D
MKKIFLLGLFLACISICESFIVPDYIVNDVDFWSKVYREWDNNEVIFYDERTKFVYNLLQLPIVKNEISSSKYKKDVEKRFNEITDVLKKIDKDFKPDPKDPLAMGIYDVLKKGGLLSQIDKEKRLRYQNGLRGQFEYGLKNSGRYADDMKAVLKSQGLPEELLALVFVESLFYLSAKSYAGASGPWGFLKETAISSGIHVNNFSDERLDPVISTMGAARYLSKAKKGLEEWPLVITSYNYGYAGMMRAVTNLSSKDFKVILDKHESPIFGYASKNYYAEFLAAYDTLQNQEKYFPKVKKEGQWKYDIVQVLRPLDVHDMVSVGALSHNDLIALNPGLTERTIAGLEVIPPEYSLRVPRGKSKHFYSRIKKIQNNKREAAGLKVSAKHKVRKNETLYTIAKRFGIFPDSLSKRMKKPLDYQPKDVVLIRSGDHMFSPLLEINKGMLSALEASKLVENPSENKKLRSF